MGTRVEFALRDLRRSLLGVVLASVEGIVFPTRLYGPFFQPIVASFACRMTGRFFVKWECDLFGVEGGVRTRVLLRGTSRLVVQGTLD